MTKWYYWTFLAIILIIMEFFAPSDKQGFALVISSVYLGTAAILKALEERHD